MTTIIQSTDLLTKAVAFISESLSQNKNQDIHTLIDEAAMKFNLSPLDSESLFRILSDIIVKK